MPDIENDLTRKAALEANPLLRVRYREEVQKAADWDAAFLDSAVGGDQRYQYVPFYKLSPQAQEQARRAYPNKSPGAKYDFKAEHFFYPVKRDGSLANARRGLAIPRAKLDDDEYMRGLGYTVRAEWKPEGPNEANLEEYDV